jgi:hypothetical protein
MTAPVGVSMGGSWTSKSDDQLKRDIDAIAALGLKWMRYDWQWFAIEQKTGVYWLEHRVQLADWIRQAGMRSLGVLGYTPTFYRQPKWASTFAMPPTSDHYDEYARYVAACAAAGSSVGVHAWEPWNECNGHQFWLEPNPDIMGRMARAARTAARAVDPYFRMVLGAFAPAADSKATPPTSYRSSTYLGKFYELGYQDAVDAVSYHPYNGGVPLSATAGQQWDMNTTVRHEIEAQMQAHGQGTKKVWSTEFGYGTAGAKGVSEAKQAQLLVEQIEFLRSRPTAGPCFVFNWQEMGPDPSIGFNSYGLVTFDGRQKQACSAIRELLT